MARPPKPQRLDRVLTTYRIGDPDGEFPIFDATGSTIAPGRWNTRDTPMIYTSGHYSTAMLENLVHANGILPPNQHYIEITIPNGTSYEYVDPARLPGWDAVSPTVAQEFGEKWHRERRSAILIVPSVVARIEHNILINPEHPEARGIIHGLHKPVWWDDRLFDSTKGHV